MKNVIEEGYAGSTLVGAAGLNAHQFAGTTFRFLNTTIGTTSAPGFVKHSTWYCTSNC